MERDALWRQQVTDSCLVIKSHASFIGAAAAEIKSMPADYVPVCLSEIEEAEGVLRRALDRIEKARQALVGKTMQAAE